MKKTAALLALLLTLGLSGCSSNASPTQSVPPVASESPSSAPISSPTPSSTFEMPEPVTYSGSGDDVISIEVPDSAYVFQISAPTNDAHFSVKGYDAQDNYTDLFVNVTEPYTGTVIDTQFSTRTLEINAECDWTITVASAYAMPVVKSGEVYQGTGDTVLCLDSDVSKISIQGNAESSYFGVITHGVDGPELLVNTTEPYQGTVKTNGTPSAIQVYASGLWALGIDTEELPEIVQTAEENAFPITADDVISILDEHVDGYTSVAPASVTPEVLDRKASEYLPAGPSYIYSLGDGISLYISESGQSGHVLNTILYVTLEELTETSAGDSGAYVAALISIFEPDADKYAEVNEELNVSSGILEEHVDVSTGSMADFMFAIANGMLTLSISPRS